MFAVQIFHLITICVFCLPFGPDISKIIGGLAFIVYAHGIIGRHKENGCNKNPSLFCITYWANVEPTKLNVKKLRTIVSYHDSDVLCFFKMHAFKLHEIVLSLAYCIMHLMNKISYQLEVMKLGLSCTFNWFLIIESIKFILLTIIDMLLSNVNKAYLVVIQEIVMWSQIFVLLLKFHHVVMFKTNISIILYIFIESNLPFLHKKYYFETIGRRNHIKQIAFYVFYKYIYC